MSSPFFIFFLFLVARPGFVRVFAGMGKGFLRLS
ncbi:hypothetical protein [Pseudomonas phage PaeP_Ls]|nr:hypothetical protein [Pseudomonas phage PaeP_Ls]